MNMLYTTAICVYGKCAGAHHEGSPVDLEAWMDQHVIDHPHSDQWPVSFRLEYPGMGSHGVAYRTAVRVA